MSDTEVIDKVKKTGAHIVLMYIAAPLTIMAIAWIFSAVTTNRSTTLSIKDGLEHLVSSMDKNTKAIQNMDRDNVEGHQAIASMIYGVKLSVGQGAVRIDNLTDQLEKSVAHMERHEQMIPKFEAWKSKVNLEIQMCKENIIKCKTEHNGGHK